MLGLRPYQSSDPVEEAPEGQSLRTVEEPLRDRITLTTRSILEVMYLLSKTVDVPDEHCRKGLVRFTRNFDGSPFDWGQVSGDLFHVCVAKNRPESAKTTLNLFNELLRLQKVGAVEGQPVLSLPLGP